MRVGVFLVYLSLSAFATAALAQQETSRVEVIGGYSVLPADRNTDFPRRTSHGFLASVTGNLTPWFGVFGELGMHFSTNRDVGPGFEGLVARTRVTEFLVGPRFTARAERVNVFAHGLVGSIQGDAGEDFSGFSDTKPAFGGGVGFDVRLRDRMAIRTQFDLIGTFADIVEGNTRFAVALAVGLGRR